MYRTIYPGNFVVHPYCSRSFISYSIRSKEYHTNFSFFPFSASASVAGTEVILPMAPVVFSYRTIPRLANQKKVKIRMVITKERIWKKKEK